jgi:hypothetical protein
MPLRLSKSQAKAYGIRAPKATVSTRQRYGGYASNWEREYAAHLEYDSKVLHWKYEAIRLILAPKTTYLPDFLVVTYRRPLEFHEVKGFWREKDRIKVKVAARMFPMFTFIGVRKVNGLWEYEQFDS